MSIKQLIVFFSVSSAFFLFILLYNVYAQSADISVPAMQSDGIYVKTSVPLDINSLKKHETALNLPKYTSRPKPAGAPKVIKNEAEAEALFAANKK